MSNRDVPFIYFIPISSLSTLGSYGNQEQHIQMQFDPQHGNKQQTEIALIVSDDMSQNAQDEYLR